MPFIVVALIIVVVIIIVIVSLIKKGVTSIGVAFKSIRTKKNTNRLRSYLESNCQKYGYFPRSKFYKVIPGEFQKLKYYTKNNPADANFEDIVYEFIDWCEYRHFVSDTLWLTPAIDYIKTHVMADMVDLLKLDYPQLIYTHHDRNDSMIAGALSRRNDLVVIPLTAKAMVGEDAAKNGFSSSDSIYYAYKLKGSSGSNAFFESAEIDMEDIESEEFSLDDI